MLEPALKLIIDVVFGLLTYTLLLRFVMQYCARRSQPRGTGCHCAQRLDRQAAAQDSPDSKDRLGGRLLQPTCSR